MFVVTVSFQPSVNLKNMFYCDIHASLNESKGKLDSIKNDDQGNLKERLKLDNFKEENLHDICSK